MKLAIILWLLTITSTCLSQTKPETKAGNYWGLNLAIQASDPFGSQLVPSLTYRVNRHLLYIGPQITFFDLHGGNVGYKFYLGKERKLVEPYISYDFQIGNSFLTTLQVCYPYSDKVIAIHNTLNFGSNWNFADRFYTNGSIGVGVANRWHSGCSSTSATVLLRLGLGYNLTSSPD